MNRHVSRIAAAASLFFVFGSVWAKDFTLTPSWESTGAYQLPESVIYDRQRDVLYVSNVNVDGFKRLGNGYISKVDTQGKVIERAWVLGLDAPKGLTIHGDKLYATDINAVVEIDINTGQIANRYVAPAAVHLNDVAADEIGNVYAADTMNDAIYRLNGIGLFSLWLQTAQLEAPNGLHFEDGNLIVGSWGFPTEGFSTPVPGHLKIVSIGSKSIKSLGNGTPAGNLDGVESDGAGGYFVTDWGSGALLHISKDGTFKQLLDLPPGAADHEVIHEKKLIVIPLMIDNKLVAFTYE